MLKLIKEEVEGLKIYKCSCGHTVSQSKNVKDDNFKCIYCGTKLIKEA